MKKIIFDFRYHAEKIATQIITQYIERDTYLSLIKKKYLEIQNSYFNTTKKKITIIIEKMLLSSTLY